MDETKYDDLNVPYVTVQHTMARFERTITRLVRLLILAILLLFASNAMWLYVWSGYDYTDVTVDSENGHANYIGASGVINNAEGESEETDQEKPQESKGH